MATKLVSTVQRWQGAPNDVKPAVISAPGVIGTPVGSTFEELGTGNIYRWNGTGWDLLNNPLTALLTQLVEYNRQQVDELRVIAGGLELMAAEMTTDPDLDLHERFNDGRDESDTDYQIAS